MNELNEMSVIPSIGIANGIVSSRVFSYILVQSARYDELKIRAQIQIQAVYRAPNQLLCMIATTIISLRRFFNNHQPTRCRLKLRDSSPAQKKYPSFEDLFL